MPRTRRKPSGTDVYHVVSRGNNQQDIFLLEKDKNRLYGIIKEQAEKFGVKIYAYCIMSNHVHILLKAEFKALSSFMRETNSMYAVYYNYKYKQSGHVFQGRFFSRYVSSNRWHFFLFIDVSLFLLFSDNSPCTSFAHFYLF